MSSEWESLPAQQLIGLLRVQAEQIRVLTAQISAQSEQITELTGQVAELTRRLGRNSLNS